MTYVVEETQRLLVVDRRGYSFRLRNVTEKCECGPHDCDCEVEIYRALRKSYPRLAIGELLEVRGLKLTGDLIEDMRVTSSIKGDGDKQPVTVDVDEYSVGCIYEEVPILDMGDHYFKGGKRVADAYFS